MPPKKDATTPDNSIVGYDNKETRILAAAFVSSIGPDKYDFPLFAKLTGFTEGTLKKFWPPIKRKVADEHLNFGVFLGGGSAAAAAPTKAVAGKKRKATNADADADAELDNASSADPVDSKVSQGKAKRAPAKNKRTKKVKTEEVEEAEVKEEDNSAAGGDGLGEFVFEKNVVAWLENADGSADVV
ncbi:hypothetical protein C7974DRAFT_371757 [Boeremia exigua]|uniref:uncharacterized protein n=1 Tax=Boeremia exigua TaxID=749465 RepID=UPI001E8E946C|nr:uncharacterized protein C7974DRAFT_371757 [Boeremia exigua]KAH6644670.1 hypothetical protein C7974DRAFT_371757 [Boeremia exigua]